MAIPDFQTLMLPLLKATADGWERSLAEITDALAAQFQLTDEERNELLPSGLQAGFDNRVGWARTDLRMAGLIEGSGRGKFRITSRGLEVLKSPLDRIDRIQARRWQNTVGRPDVQAFAGALMGKKANKGVFITTSQFSQEAQNYVNTISQKIVLIDGEQLAQLMIDHEVGVTKVATGALQKFSTLTLIFFFPTDSFLEAIDWKRRQRTVNSQLPTLNCFFILILASKSS